MSFQCMSAVLPHECSRALLAAAAGFSLFYQESGRVQWCFAWPWLGVESDCLSVLLSAVIYTCLWHCMCVGWSHIISINHCHMIHIHIPLHSSNVHGKDTASLFDECMNLFCLFVDGCSMLRYSQVSIYTKPACWLLPLGLTPHVTLPTHFYSLVADRGCSSVMETSTRSSADHTSEVHAHWPATTCMSQNHLGYYWIICVILRFVHSWHCYCC